MNKSSDNKLFWSRIAGRYDFIMKKDARSYDTMYRLLAEDLTPDMRVLELATGTGLVALHIAAFVQSIDATDFSPDMIAKAGKKPSPENVRFSVEDATLLTFADASFDAVIISNALHIIPEPEQVLSEISRVLKQDGILIAPTFAHNGNLKERLLLRIMSLSGFKAFHKWTPEDYIQFIEQNGFKVTRQEIIGASFPLVYVVASAGKGEPG